MAARRYPCVTGRASLSGERSFEGENDRASERYRELAQTLDGRGAASSGSSQWISCPDSLRFAHEIRASHDAVIVGAGPALKDDPRLTVRRVPGEDPLRVADSKLHTPLTAAVPLMYGLRAEKADP